MRIKSRVHILSLYITLLFDDDPIDVSSPSHKSFLLLYRIRKVNTYVSTRFYMIKSLIVSLSSGKKRAVRLPTQQLFHMTYSVITPHAMRSPESPAGWDT